MRTLSQSMIEEVIATLYLACGFLSVIAEAPKLVSAAIFMKSFFDFLNAISCAVLEIREERRRSEKP